MRHLYVDSTVGGNGDLWMRLVGFYSMAALKPDIRIHLLIPKFIRTLTDPVFGDRLVFEDAKTPDMKLTYTGLGLRSLIPGILKGERYIAPFQRAIVAERKKKSLTDPLNMLLFEIADKLGFVHLPSKQTGLSFHGYMETAGIKAFRDISFDAFSVQVNKDWPLIYERLNGEIPLSPELKVPDDMNENIVFFANGRSRQFAPLWWAKENFPDAYYAFFHLEPDYELFKQNGMKVIPYYKEAGDIIAIAKHAKWVVCTDSFPSHVIQSANPRATILITEVIPARVISPAFKGKVVDNEAPCHPCLHSFRDLPCDAGYFECLNWKIEKYTSNIKKSVP